ncbi:hypothetical protein G4B88_025624 [Cannabis sativa]|uniref:RNase H type-1 domain-containing protein n=1 Tax=Cannabis sativa TaxID=3483 RepID=A0A7J6EBB1_CANSA|nr:hypothetical protein G4B88_025624 [Cannabis sativa]
MTSSMLLLAIALLKLRKAFSRGLSFLIVDSFGNSWKDKSALSSLIHQIWESLSFFPNATLQHIPRSQNQDAHLNAGKALRLDLDLVWRI